MRALAGLAAVALPLAAAAQGAGLRRPSVGADLPVLERLAGQAQERDRAAALAHPEDLGLQQVFVLPERPGQNQVAWYGFAWQYVDVPAPGGGPGGLRLYFYRGEQSQARRALPVILDAWARLRDVFHYDPTRRIPFILYATQREFQTQNVFQVSEAVLGVTSPDDLKMTVPYFGDHARFREVATHELVHQFQIQKMMDLAGSDAASAIEVLPLWFVEGIAEYYSRGGIDGESDLFLRDLVWNPDPAHGYQVPAFADDRLLGYIPTYKLGQARVAFLADTYGQERIQALVEQASLPDAGAGEGRAFAGLVQRVLGEPVEQVDARWRAWLKRRTYPTWLAARQELSGVRELRRLPGEPEACTTSPDGEVVLCRTLDREHGRAHLVLADARRPQLAEVVASDDRPGLESLHPVDHGVAALGRDVLVFSAQAGIGDQLYLRSYRRTPAAGGRPAALRVGPLRPLEVLSPEGERFVAIADPALSPDGRRLAFVGVTAAGLQELYVVPLEGPPRARRVTEDPYAKKDLAWDRGPGPGGLVFASDATEHGRLNLFRLDPDTGLRTRLTTGAAEDRHPAPRGDGSLLFSSDAAGKPDLWELRDGRRRRLTDFATGLVAPHPAGDGQGVLAGTFLGGRFRLVEVQPIALLDEPWQEITPPQGEPRPILETDLPAAQDYRPLSPRNWRPDAGFVFAGGDGASLSGRAAVLFSDTLRDRVAFVDVSVYGGLEYTQGLALYQDRSRRTGLVLGASHTVQQQLDALDPYLAYLQRDYGLVGALSRPLDRYRRVELELGLGATERYCPTDFSGLVVLDCGGLQRAGGPYAGTRDWRRRNGGTNLTVSPAVRYGHDSVRYHPTAGPVDGASLLLELGGGWLPGRGAVHGFVTADAERFVPLLGRTRLWLRLALGASFSPGGESRLWERSFWLTSEDNLRGYGPGDAAYLIGTHYYVANAELRLPLDPAFRLAFFEYLTGVVGVDFGGVFTAWDGRRDGSGALVEPGAWGSRTLTGVLGLDLTIGPILFRLAFGHPFGIGGVRTPALAAHQAWVTNVTLRYVFI
jgi:hypothetical protein